MSGKKAVRLAGSTSKSTQTASIFDPLFCKKTSCREMALCGKQNPPQSNQTPKT